MSWLLALVAGVSYGLIVAVCGMLAARVMALGESCGYREDIPEAER